MRREPGGGERAWAAQGADALERASRVRTVVFDKTGTLTRGAPAVTGHALFGGAALHGALALAAAAEASSEHPLARALLAYARARLAPGAPAGRGGAADEQAAGSPRAEGAPGKARVLRVYRVFRVFRVFRVYRVYHVFRVFRGFRVCRVSVFLCFSCFGLTTIALHCQLLASLIGITKNFQKRREQ